MRRKTLAAPREVDRESNPAGTVPPPLVDVLGDPVRARPRLRRLFDPVAGRFRRLERAVNQFLSRNIYTRIPGSERPYDWILDRSLTVYEAEAVLDRLHPAFDGMSVLLVTDIHAGPFVTREALCRTFRRLAALEPDLVLLAGDLTTSRTEEFEDCAAALDAMRPRHGIYAVLGNHDHYTLAPDAVAGSAEACGVTMLQNRWVALESGSGRMFLAGIDDLNIGRPDLESALEGIPGGGPVILLSHNPDILFEASARGVGLVLAGHTHGGQIRIPGLPVLVRMSRYRLDEGRYTANGTELVVSRGLGVTGIPFRLACPPEAVLLRLRSGRPESAQDSAPDAEK